MNINHVQGKHCGKIFIYALSTCAWCKKTKNFLNELGLEYEYIDVDTLDDNERSNIEKEIAKWNPSLSFPTIILNNKKCIVGYDPNQIKADLKL